MFFSAFISLGLAATAVAGPFRRDGGLTVSVATSLAKVASIDELVLTATVTNTGAETLKVLKYNTVLDAGISKSFAVSKGDVDVKFQGARVQVSIPGLDETNYATIAAGESVTVVHEVGKLYDFSAIGTSAFIFTAQADFQIISELNAARGAQSINEFTLVTVPEVAPVTIEVTTDVAKRDHFEEKRARVTCSNASQASFITASYNEAKVLASRASSYITAQTNPALYTAYYKTNSRTTISGIFNAVANENSASRTLSCVDVQGICGGGTIAYNLIATTNIYYCPIFFQEVATSSLCSGTTVASRNVRGGTTLHEIVHAVDIAQT